MNTLIWFQRDLRINNNPSLSWAIQRGQPIIAIYIHSPGEDYPWSTGAASRWWLYHSLKNLEKNLKQLGIHLYFYKGDSTKIIPKLTHLHQIEAIVWTKRHEPQRVQCEAKISQYLRNRGQQVKIFEAGLLRHAQQFLTQTNQTPYRKFTPFYKRLRQKLQLYNPIDMPIVNRGIISQKKLSLGDSLSLEQLDLLDKTPWYKKLHQYWTPGEDNIDARLDNFIEQNIEQYNTQRDYPAIHGTSMLSPHLHFGEISPWQIYSKLLPYLYFEQVDKADGSESFLRQLIWREFAQYILQHFPNTNNKPMNSHFSHSFWQTNKELLDRWQNGQTGVPIIDAGMKQLWETGWMHNRVRMLTASFLTKNLGLSWIDGANWFWNTLVDADLANNSMGWQWVAGCGVDASPYFRIFNPNTQEKRFDSKQIYIKQWLSPQEINRPSIIPVNQSRKDAIVRYNKLKQRAHSK